jgi:RHH-type proline utilization regulon transcriptional repressor/proline dehydrogenase/delta 1-pyrroline-5-carboxylate dehydrogenase
MRLPYPYRDEAQVVRGLAASLRGRLDWSDVVARAQPWVEAVRRHPPPFWAMESLLREYPINSAEGLALMRLAEALLRVPDAHTAVALTADQLSRAQFDASREGPHRLLASLAASAVAMSKRFLPDADVDTGLIRRLGAHTVVAAAVRAVQLLGRQFVLGRDIGEALREAADQRRAQPALRFSYDMLGEGARTDPDALRYLGSYRRAIDAITRAQAAASPREGDGISVKLSALFARYEEAQRDRVFSVLLPRIWQLADAAARADINLTIDAEESERLELSLDLFDALAERAAGAFPRWEGLGLAVQAYQTRALDVVGEVLRIARARGTRLMVRLVKGAYWDGEIKRAQELGLPAYPVFTHKRHTDLSYLACARALLAEPTCVYPQFATHNAGTIAAIAQMARAAGAPFEMQRLHGMGEGVYREFLRSQEAADVCEPTTAEAGRSPRPATASAGAGAPLRIYAPVGEHRDLLAYLVRRLLENGANSSFVHQLADESVSVRSLLTSPLVAPDDPPPRPSLPLPVELYGPQRPNSRGVDLACEADRQPWLDAFAHVAVKAVPVASDGDIGAAMQRLRRGFERWNAQPVGRRANALRRAADALEAAMPRFGALLVAEGRKTLPDAVAEVREAIDFLRYYAAQAEEKLVTLPLPGPTGESNSLQLHGRGVFVCISPWNFPLAIFTGQVAAALVAGNAVAAKPAEQTPAVARAMVDLLRAHGIPPDALELLHGPGETVGAALVAHPDTAGVCFTGSTAVAKAINRSLAAKDGPIVPLVAETGGINAMIVDSSALPEQVIDAVVQSAFRSAGQRCSALRLLVVQDEIADTVIDMLRGALAEIRVGDPAALSSELGPIIDDLAFEGLRRHVERLAGDARLIGEAPPFAHWQSLHDVPRAPHDAHRLFRPIAFELPAVAALQHEVFGPILHVVRWHGEVEDVIQQINALGYGLTLGIQTRIDSRAERLAALARVGNIYVNRNMVGAVVGVQPFGGEGLSGTGPKAGGPNYLQRFCTERTVTVNTAAAGGNVGLLAAASSDR